MTEQGQRKSVEEAIRLAKGWRMVETHPPAYAAHYPRLTSSNPFVVLAENTYTEEELRAADPRWPEVFRHIFHTDPGNTIGVSAVGAAEKLAHTARYWAQDYIVLPDAAFSRKPKRPHFISKIQGVECAKDGTVRLSYLRFDRKFTPEGVLYCDRPEKGAVKVREKWMNLTYPGWEKRLAAADLLDLSYHDKAEMILVQPTATATDAQLREVLPDIDF